MEWYGWFLLGLTFVAMGLMMWFLPGYAPEGVTYTTAIPTLAAPTAGLGAGFALRGAWIRVA